MKYFFTTILIIVFISAVSFAQKDTVVVNDYFETGQEGTLNNAVQAAIDAGTVSNTVFKLKPYGTYVLTGAIDLSNQPGATLEIVADPPGNTQVTAPPMICWTASTAPNKTYLFDIAGKLIMKNVWILWADLGGNRFTSTIRIGDSSSVSGGRCEFENVIFDYVQQASSGAIQPYATHFVGTFKNCYFRNCTDNHFRYYSRAVSLPFTQASTYGGLHADSVSFENCTFANIGYVYMQEKDYYTDNVYFNHCTFYNVVMFPLESGEWWKMYVTNSLFINTFMFGTIPSADGATPNGGTISIAPIDSGALGTGFGFDVPFTEQDRHILFANNNYYIEPWLVDWMKNNPYSKEQHIDRHDENIPLPQPILNSPTLTFFDSTNTDGSKAWPYINKANLDSLNPGFLNPPINLDSLKVFLYNKWNDNSDNAWAWDAGYLNGSGGQVWPLSEDLSYTNTELKSAAMGGFPLGDLYHWWPEEYSQWKAQEDAEYDRIFTWLETGQDPATGITELPGNPTRYNLSQNYPNPFNPTTRIEYSIPKSSFVSLKIYNLLGQEVATLFSGNQKPGNYVVPFDGEGLASGIYLYQLQSENVSITKKLILMK